jgi:AcrR family transcriptional regulator
MPRSENAEKPGRAEKVAAPAAAQKKKPSAGKQKAATDAKPRPKAAKKKAADRLADARHRMYHDLIFEAAESVFGRNGYERASMQQIAEEAGVSLKTVYATFESKQELFEDITDIRATAFYESITLAIEGDDDPRDRLARAALAYTAYLFEHEEWLRIHLHGRIAWAFRPKDPKVAARWDLGRETFSNLLRDGMECSVFYAGDPDELALLVQTIMQVIVGRSLQQGETDAQVVADAIVLHVGRMLGGGGQ